MARSTPARNSRGRFVKGASRSRARSTSTALAVRSSTAVARRSGGQTILVVPSAKKKIKHHRRGRRGGGGPKTILGPVRRSGVADRFKENLPGMAGSAGYAYITRGTTEMAKKLQDYVKKLPTFDQIGVPASHGVLLTLVACNTDGWPSKIADLLGEAALRKFAENMGAYNFDLEKAATISGDDGDGDVEIGAL